MLSKSELIQLRKKEVKQKLRCDKLKEMYEDRNEIFKEINNDYRFLDHNCLNLEETNKSRSENLSDLRKINKKIEKLIFKIKINGN